MRRLRILHEFARRGTITDAAAALHYTPSAVSQQLSALQREIGQVLLEPAGRRLQLTDLGHTLAEHAAEILAAEQRARIALEQQQEVLTGKLQVGALATIAASLVPPAMAILARRHPQISVRTREVRPEDALMSVRDGDLDLAFVLDYPDAPMPWELSLESTVVGVEQHHLIVPSGWLPDGPVDLAELAGYDWGVSGGDTDFGRALMTVCRLAGFEPHIAHQVDEQATAMAMVAGQLGVTLVGDLGLALLPRGAEVRTLRQPVLRRVVLVRRQAIHHRRHLQRLGVAASRSLSVPDLRLPLMDETSRTRQTAQAYIDVTERRDWQALAELLTDDVVYEMPQTRERIRGRSRFLQFNADYPGDWHLRTRRIVADGRHAAVWIDARVGSERMDACVWLELSEHGLISRITDYWPEQYAPPPGREHLVERC